MASTMHVARSRLIPLTGLDLLPGNGILLFEFLLLVVETTASIPGREDGCRLVAVQEEIKQRVAVQPGMENECVALPATGGGGSACSATRRRMPSALR